MNDKNSYYIINYIKNILEIPNNYSKYLEVLKIIIEQMCFYLKNYDPTKFEICFNEIYPNIFNIETNKLSEYISDIINSYQNT